MTTENVESANILFPVLDMSRMGVTQSSHVLLPLHHFMTFCNSILHKTVQALMMKEGADTNSMIPVRAEVYPCRYRSLFNSNHAVNQR
jgi:hypothetical protein